MAARHLVIPMQPTPNGRLHIGHGAGPYLRADVLARTIRRSGGEASIITGSDAYENWVLADARATGRTPAQTCAFFHAGITADLDHLGVELTTWIDPLSEEHAAPYRDLHDDLLQQLRASGTTQLEDEQVPVGVHTGRPVTGVWLAGRCPTCSADVGGNTCTGCGDSFTPEQLLDPRSRLDDEPVRWVTSSNWFVRPTDPALISASLRATGLRDDLLAPALRYIDKRGARVRLSQPGDWGVSSPQAPDGSVLTNTYAAYSLYCAQLEARQHGAALNALHRDSDVVVIGLFGTDNSIGGLVAPHVIATASTMFRPHDHTIVNHMLHFEGRKCSTSQQHGPLISDLITHTSLTTDELRYALCHLPLDQSIASLSTHDLVEHVNHLRHWSGDRMALAWQNAAGPASPRLLAALGHRQERQERHLVPSTFDLAAATAIVDDWILDTSIDVRQPQIAAGWLIGTALLAAPMMPQLAQDIWSGMGLPAAPSHANPAVLSASVTPAPHRTPAGEGRTAVTVAEISPYARSAATPVPSIH